MLPSDIGMLISLINMKLRDQYDSLDRLCDDMDEDKADLLERLKAAGHYYDEDHNCIK